MKDWREDPTVIRIMKLRKRHVRVALERQEKMRQQAEQGRPCFQCKQTAEPIYEEGVYKGHACAQGHLQYISKRIRDPSAPITPTEKADVRALPSQGFAPARINAQELKSALESQRALQQRFVAESGDKDWSNRLSGDLSVSPQ